VPLAIALREWLRKQGRQSATTNYELDYSENRAKALLQLLNKSINKRVEFYQQEFNDALINHGIKVSERLFCLFEKVDVLGSVTKLKRNFTNLFNHLVALLRQDGGRKTI